MNLIRGHLCWEAYVRHCTGGVSDLEQAMSTLLVLVLGA